MSIINLLPKITPQSDDHRKAAAERRLLQMEAQIGGQLFGPVPKGHRRQFFCLDEHTWIWHEEWKDQAGQTKAVTTRYEVRPNGIIKSQDGQMSYQRLSDQEARNLIRAVRLYDKRVTQQYQRLLQPV